MSKALKNYAERKGWKYNKKVASGEERGYLFTIIQKPRTKTFIFPLTHITDADQIRVKNYLNEQKTELNLREFNFDNSVLFIHVKEAFKSMTEDEMNLLLSVLTNYFITNNIGTNRYCVFCGLEEPDDQCTLNNIQYHTHGSCYRHHLKSNKKKIKDYKNRNYLLGTLGAILGGLVGAIPWFIVNYFGIFTSILGYLIGKASLKGYTLLGGKYGFKTRWIILACVIFSVIFAEMMSYVVVFAIEGYDFAFLFSSIFYDLSNFLINVGVGMLFAFLGIYRLFKDLGED